MGLRPGHLAAISGSLPLPVPPVAHVATIDDVNLRVALVLVVDDILADYGVVGHVRRIAFGTAAPARAVQKVQLRELAANRDAFDFLRFVGQLFAAQLQEPLLDLEFHPAESLNARRTLPEVVFLELAAAVKRLFE